MTDKVSIVGTVDDPEDNLWFYRVYSARADLVDLANLNLQDPDWTILAQNDSGGH